MHHVAVLALPNVVPLDLGIACSLFASAQDEAARGLYAVSVCGESEEVGAGLFSLRVPWGLERLASADTIIIPGLEGPELPVSQRVIAALQAASRRGVRIGSICSGAFVVAAAGLAEGRRIATHWRAAPMLAQRYPGVIVDPDVLYVDGGTLISSAGASAGIDMCLYIIGKDHGHAAAARASRMAVAPLHRDGGQTQFIEYEAPRSHTSLAALLDWMEVNLAASFTTEQLARRAGMSARTFHRRFRDQTGTTPLQWVIRARIGKVRTLLETTDLPIGLISEQCGFEAPELLRDHFRRIVGVSPKDYRAAFTLQSIAVAGKSP